MCTPKLPYYNDVFIEYNILYWMFLQLRVKKTCIRKLNDCKPRSNIKLKVQETLFVV